MAPRGLTVAPALCLVGIVVVLASAVGVAAFDVAADATSPDVSRPRTLSVSAQDGCLTFDHRGGPPLDVRNLTLQVAVGGEPLRHQPSVPFFAARGFRPGPTGPFNVASDPAWSVGETASLCLAGTNAPAIRAGRTVRVRVGVESERASLTLRTTAR